VRKYSRAQVLEHRLINHDINHVTSNNMDSARLERWVDNDGCGAQNASRGDSELTAREHAMKHGYWTGTYQPEVQEYLAYSAELSTLSPSAHNQDEGVGPHPPSLGSSHDPSLVEIIGEFNNRVAKYARAGHIYSGPRPSLKLQYPPDSTPERCHTSYGPRSSRHHRLTIQASKMIHLPNGKTLPTTNYDLEDIAVALAHEQPGSYGHFGRGDVETLERGVVASLDNLYLGYDEKSNYSIAAQGSDSRTGGRVVVATKKAPDIWGDTYSVEVRYFKEHSHPSAHIQSSSRAPFSSQHE